MTTEERVMSLFESANPVPEPDNSTPLTASDYLATLDRRTSTMTLTAIEPEAPEHNNSKRPWLMAAAAVAALTLVAGLILAATRTGEVPVPADQPEPTLPAGEPESKAPTTALDIDGSEASPFDADALIAVGERVVTALNTDDPDTIAQLVSVSADPISVFGATSRVDLVNLFGWINASDWSFELQACEAREPDQVQCTVLQSNDWATAAGAEPAEGTLSLRIEDGQVVSMIYLFDNSPVTSAYGEAFGDFYAFVLDRDRDDAAAMWATAGDGRTLWPTLTDESFELFEQYTAEYVEARTNNTTPTAEP